MSNIPQRWHGENQWYFVTVVTQDRKPWLCDSKNPELLLECFRYVHEIYSFRLAALTILSDHFHMLLGPPVEHLGDVIGGIKKRMWNQLREQDNSLSKIWQSRFLDHRIRNEDDFALHIEYIRNNPLKHELVNDSEEWPWTFIHEKAF